MALPKSSRSGLWLFAVYCLAYFAYMLVSAFHSEWLAAEAPGGVNVAIAWGFGLIFLAILLSVLHLWSAVAPHEKENQ